MADRNRSGFMLVELLVVVVIIAMLVGLLLPAVIGARESARQAGCINNQNELSVALLQYETAKGHLPGYINSFGPINRGNPAAIPLGWPVVLIEYLGREDLWREWRVGNRPIVEMPQMVCPSDASENDGLSYVVNCGLPDPVIDPATYDPAFPPDAVMYGLFHDRFFFDGPEVTSEQIRDGTSQTLMLSENVQATHWADVTEAQIGMVWSLDPLAPGACGNAGLLPVAINDCLEAAPPAPPDDIIYARPSSRHPGGVVVTYADGHQDFLADDIDYNVLRALMAPDDAGAGLP